MLVRDGLKDLTGAVATVWPRTIVPTWMVRRLGDSFRYAVRQDWGIRTNLGWCRTSYRNFALRCVPGAAALPSLFVDVLQPTDDGVLLVAQMSTATAHPGR